MMLSLQGSRLIGEPGGIIRWASKRCRFWRFSFLLAAPNVSQFCCALAENSFAHCKKKSTPVVFLTSQGKINTPLENNSQLSGKFSLNSFVLGGLNVQTYPLVAPVLPQACNHHCGTGTEWTTSCSTDHCHPGLHLHFLPFPQYNWTTKMEHRHCSWCISFRDKGWYAQGRSRRRNIEILTDLQNWCGWKGLALRFELGFHILPYEYFIMKPACFRPRCLDIVLYLWLLSTPSACPALAQCHLRWVRSAPALLGSSLSIIPVLSFDKVSAKKSACWCIVCCWCHRWWRHPPHPAWQHGCSYFHLDEILSSGGATWGKEEEFFSLHAKAKLDKKAEEWL